MKSKVIQEKVKIIKLHKGYVVGNIKAGYIIKMTVEDADGSTFTYKEITPRAYQIPYWNNKEGDTIDLDFAYYTWLPFKKKPLFKVAGGK